jgi:hypothetical protein
MVVATKINIFQVNKIGEITNENKMAYPYSSSVLSED